jgi:hypothetical protein
VSARHFPDWLSDYRLDPRGEALLGGRLERSTWWSPVTDEPAPPSLLERDPVMPAVSGRRLDPAVAASAPLLEDAARISPRGVSGADRDLGLGTVHRADDFTVFGRSPWTFEAGWR